MALAVDVLSRNPEAKPQPHSVGRDFFLVELVSLEPGPRRSEQVTVKLLGFAKTTCCYKCALCIPGCAARRPGRLMARTSSQDTVDRKKALACLRQLAAALQDQGQQIGSEFLHASASL